MFCLASQFLAACFTFIFIIVKVGVAYANGSFQSPVLREIPAVAVAGARSYEPSFKAVVGHVLRKRAMRQPAYIIIGVMCMESEKMSGKSFFCPQAELRLEEEMFPFTVITECKRIPASRQVQRCPVARLKLCTQVQAGCYII